MSSASVALTASSAIGAAGYLGFESNSETATDATPADRHWDSPRLQRYNSLH